MAIAARRLAARARRRQALGPMLGLSLALHLTFLLAFLIMPGSPPTGAPGPELVEIMVDPGTAADEKPPAQSSAPAFAVPTEALPEAPVPPPPPVSQAPPPPPPPPDQTDLASLQPPPEPAPPPQATPPPAPPKREVARTIRPSRPVRQPSQIASNQAPSEPSPGPQAADPTGAPAEGPETAVQVEGAQLGPEWIRQLQAWWDQHAFFPGQAAAMGVGGTVKVHLLVHPDGEVAAMHVVQGSGSKVIDNAAYDAFQGAHLHPFPPGTPAPRADVYITLHYVLTHGQVLAALLRRPFTVTNKPLAPGAVVATTQQRTCTGILVLDSAGELDSLRGRRGWAQATFYRAPDGKPRVRFRTSLNGGDVDAPVSEADGSAGWAGQVEHKQGLNIDQKFYSIWPEGPDHVSGDVKDTSDPTADGTIDLTCGPAPPK